MKVDEGKAKWTLEHAGRRWYCCSEGCLKRFDAEPAKYEGTGLATTEMVSPGPAQASHECCGGGHGAAGVKSALHAPVRAKDSCPMHPESVRDARGRWPMCGVAG